MNSQPAFLKLALTWEVKGTQIYLDLARRAENPLSRKLFYSLAKQEIDHAERVNNIYDALQTKTLNWQNIPLTKLPPIENELKRLFTNLKRRGLNKKAANTKGYESAMEMERKSYAMYQKFAGQSENVLEKDFFQQLMKEEAAHLTSLQNVYYYLTRTREWFQEEESKVWSWMNW